ncbi:histidine kinase dimerization/phospho-acceptor domain-containing protein, partial [Patescibacteria group bacterium]
MSLVEERKIKRIHTLKGIIIGRWFLIIGLGLLGLIQIFAGITIISFTIGMWVVLAVVPILYNAVYSHYIFRASDKLTDRKLHILSFSQVFVDQLVFTAIIYLTGGIESVGYLLYLFPIMSAAILYSDIRIISFSLLTVFWYTAMIILEFNAVIPHFPRYLHDPGFYQNAERTLANTISIDLILLFMLDKRKHIQLINPPARDILRFYGDFSGPELRKHDFPKAYSALIKVIREQPTSKRLGQEVDVKEGQNKSTIQVDSIPIFSAGGSIVSWVKVLRDVTREKELDQIKSDFISVAAHQLRTPLAALKWFFKLMVEGDAGKVTKKQQDLLDKAYDRTLVIIDIVNNLLDISEIEEGRFPYEFKEGDITDVIKT